MSGATLAAGPRMAKERKGRLSAVDENVSDFGGLGGVMGSFRVIELQLMAFIVVFSASGLVPLIDILFPVVISIYAVVIGKLVFPRYKNAELSVFKGNRVFQAYVIFGTLVGLFLPLAYVLGGFARNDQEAVRAATPHLFLLSCQVLSENLVSGLQIFSLPVRALMPLMYNTRRLFALVDWTEEMWITRHLSAHPTLNVSDYLDGSSCSDSRSQLIRFPCPIACFPTGRVEATEDWMLTNFTSADLLRRLCTSSSYCKS